MNYYGPAKPHFLDALNAIARENYEEALTHINIAI